jgi:hypothetical protein
MILNVVLVSMSNPSLNFRTIDVQNGIDVWSAIIIEVGTAGNILDQEVFGSNLADRH